MQRVLRHSSLLRFGKALVKQDTMPKALFGNVLIQKTAFSQQVPKENPTENDKKEVMKLDYDEYDDYEPKTPREKVTFYAVITGRLILIGFGLACLYMTGRELFPGRMNPNSLYSEVFDFLRHNDQIMEQAGGDMVAFGRDVGRNTEGRRNHVDSYKYKAEDGTNRLRIRMNLKGSKGQMRVWAEVVEGMAHNDFSYVICQNVKNGKVITILDRRDDLEANMGSGSGDNSISKFFLGKK